MKKGKTKKIVALASVLALSCTCGAAALVSNAYEAPVAVYAEETTKSEEVLQFESLVQDIVDLENGFTGTDITEDKNIAESVYVAYMQYIEVENAELIAEVDAGIYATYSGYEAQFKDMILAASEADKIYDNFKYATDVIYANEREDYMDAFDFSSFSATKQEIIDTLGLMLTSRSAKAAEMEKYFKEKADAELAAKDVVDAIATPIKIASLSEIEAAYDVVEAVYGTLEVSAEDSVIIANCVVTLGEYMGKYNELVKAVDDLKDVIEALPAKYDAGDRDFTPAYMLGVIKTYNDLTSEQQGKINEEKIPGTDKTYKFQMQEYYELATEANKLAAPVIDAIKAIPETDAIAISDKGTIDNARAKYNALKEHGKGFEAFVFNYSTLEAAEAKMLTITADVDTWKEMIADLLGDREPIEIILEDAEKIGDIVGFYSDNFSAEMKAYVQSYEVVAYEKYIKITDTLEGIYKKIEDVSKAYMAIPPVVADYETAIGTYIDEVNAFCAAYKSAKDAYDALTDAEKDYFAENYDEAVAKKTSAEADNEVYGVEGLILAIRDENKTTCAQDLKLADAKTVKAAYEKYTNFDGEVKALFAAKVEDAYAQIEAIEKELDQWIKDVLDIVGTDFKLQDITDGSDFVNFFEDIADFDAEQLKYVADAIDALDAEGKEIEDNINAMNDAIAALNGKTTLTADDRDSLDNLAALYEKMHQSQKDLIPDYSRVVESTKERIATAEAFEALIAKIQTVYTKDNYAFVLAVEALYENLDDEIKGLISEESKEALDEAVASFNADDAVILDIDAIKKDLDQKIADLNAAKLALEQADATNKAELVEKITALETALNTANTNISALQGKIDALDAAYKAADDVLDGKITGLQTALNTANTNISALQGKIDALDAAYKAADVVLDGKITALKTELQGKINDLAAELNTAKTDLLAADATNKAELQGKIDALETALNTAKTALETADADIIEDLEAVEAKLDAAKAELEQTIADLEAELKAADDANKAELKAEIDALRKSLTTATVILAIVSGLAFAGVVALFVLKFFVKKKD